MDPTRTKHILEACLLVAGRPLGVPQLEALFDADEERPDRDAIREALKALAEDYEGRGIDLVEVAGGWRLQSRADMQRWTQRLFQEKVPRYSRALLETLVLVAYRQPITRGEIEEVRGVAVSSNIVRTLQERQWVREVGYKDVPGKPALLGTTRQFLDYFNLKRLEDLPTLGELKDLDSFDAVLAGTGPVEGAGEGDAANDDGASQVAEAPEAPEGQERSETSETPESPEAPETPESPETPETSETPETPEATDAGGAPGVSSATEASYDERESPERDDEARASEVRDAEASDRAPADEPDAVRTAEAGLSGPHELDAVLPVVATTGAEPGAPDAGTAVTDSAPTTAPQGAEAHQPDHFSVGIDLPLVDDSVSVDLERYREPGADTSARTEAATSEGERPYEDPQTALRRVVDAYAAEHRRDLDAAAPVARGVGGAGDALPDDVVESLVETAEVGDEPDGDAPDRKDRVP